MADALLAGRYRLDAQIGSGGMGRVWRARDVRLDRDVAIKTVDLAGVSDPTVAGRFQREIVVTARLTHPNTVTVFDGGVDGNTAYLVMELLGGQTLAHWIATHGPLALGPGLDVARQVVTGLAAAHAVGLVHRDIKPANVMITGRQVKLLDFGIAQLVNQAEAGLTATAMAIGTAAYMSPEQAAGQRVDTATDLYAVGCLLMTLFTGRPPFDGDAAVAVAAQQLTAVPPRLSQRRGGLPYALDALVDRLLSKNAAARPTAAETLAALQRLGEDAATAAVPIAAAPSLAATLAATAPLRGTTTPPATLPLAGSSPAVQRVLDLPVPSQAPWIAGVLVSLMLAALLGGVAYSLTASATAGWVGLLPGASPSASRKPTPSRTPSRPATTAPATPDPGQRVALDAALAGVRTVLSSLPDSKDKRQLVRRWTLVSPLIAAGPNPQKRLDSFQGEVDKSKLGVIEKQAVTAALAIVRPLVR